MCDQQWLRLACTYAQADQSLCLSLEYSMTVKLLTEHHLEFLSLIGGCTGSSESTLVKIPHCWKSHVTAQCKHNMDQDLTNDMASDSLLSSLLFHFSFTLTSSFPDSLFLYSLFLPVYLSFLSVSSSLQFSPHLSHYLHSVSSLSTHKHTPRFIQISLCKIQELFKDF